MNSYSAISQTCFACLGRCYGLALPAPDSTPVYAGRCRGLDCPSPAIDLMLNSWYGCKYRVLLWTLTMQSPDLAVLHGHCIRVMGDPPDTLFAPSFVPAFFSRVKCSDFFPLFIPDLALGGLPLACSSLVHTQGGRAGVSMTSIPLPQQCAQPWSSSFSDIRNFSVNSLDFL